MNNLNDILGINLNEISLLDIDEEILIKLKACDYHTQSNFYFWLINEINKLENTKDFTELSHCHFLMSYFLYVIFTPMCYEELAFNHANKANTLNPSVKYKEWLLMFAILPNGFIKPYDTIKLAEDVLEVNPSSEIANAIISMF
ncbi:hypothetical protein K5V21_08225 [Clostridium sardiniense]|uniref:Uncharacterized protein n=1 Tax=Clostridium sardiniense TaxID=29369 RepID=A0ABS7KXB1_CLOSR|nr:hypothetical protein [Clostridium sardiniense]MBY0755441.1 hypothetical protein [Clostridium sardiniense]MDQ0461570.1 hypothetical protein [Clostridium sardiniense]